MDSYYVVHYWDDNGKPGKCKTDHPLKKDELFYAGNGRATVRGCRLEQSSPMPIPARTLHALSKMNIIKE
jgi:hypothetical protein